MEKSLPAPSDSARGPEWPRALGGSEINLLLVSRSPAWRRAVRRATVALGGGDVLTCDARGALARLAGTASHYSHLLVDRNDAEGLFDELADLATEVAAPDTGLLVLGSADASHPNTNHPNIRVVPTATSRSIAEALMASPPPRGGPAMNLAELTAALQGAMIETRYQPIVRVTDRRPVGVEALARLNHPLRGTLAPDRFVPQIEDAGLAAELTGLVSARAFADLAGPFLAGRDLRMSVNFPLDVLLQPAALDRLEEQRIAAGLTADRIVIELTESRPVDDFPMLRHSLERLRTLGYGAAIDDVGPAVPRLAPLLDLPFTSLKLDKELVQQVDVSAEVRTFLANTIVQAHAHGLTVVAEGVETQAIWDQMRDLGVDEVQGFLAARPLPVAAVPIWWDAWLEQSKPGA
jgi:EAL domain-containing protein (putative c-di-GMP-specific phosphodiesterase class I)